MISLRIWTNYIDSRKYILIVWMSVSPSKTAVPNTSIHFLASFRGISLTRGIGLHTGLNVLTTKLSWNVTIRFHYPTCIIFWLDISQLSHNFTRNVRLSQQRHDRRAPHHWTWHLDQNHLLQFNIIKCIWCNRKTCLLKAGSS